MVIRRVCREPGCPVFTGRDGVCTSHKPEPWVGSRGRGGATLNSTQWRKVRVDVLERDDYRCADCFGPGMTVDHIVPVAEGGHDDLNNLQTMCAPCHQTKTSAEAARGRARSKKT